MQNDIENILNEIAAKDSQVLCREVLSIGDTMDVLRSKWTVEILTAILEGAHGVHFGRVFEINDLAVAPRHQRKGIASQLLRQCLDDMKAQGMVGFHLITACDGVLSSFYESFDFKKEERVMLMGL